MTDAPVQLLVHVGPKRAEKLWAEPLGGTRYRLRSIPFLATGMSLGDVVEAIDGRVEKVLERGGHSTFRLKLRDHPTPAAFATLWAPLAALGCVCESTSGGIFAVDVPSAADLGRVNAALERGITAEDWDVEPADVRLRN